MHIPDGFLDVKTAVASGTLAATGVGAALWQAKRTLPSRRVPLLGVTAAFVFAAQMLNFPVAGGTSGHLVGGVLAAVLLGPGAAIIVLTTVLLVQCFLFADGGVTALGANIFNMGLIDVVTGYAIYLGVRRVVTGQRGLVLAAAFAGWCATVLAAICCAGEVAWSGKVAWRLVFPAMTGVHMLIGIGEGAITALVLLAIVRVRPELVERKTDVPQPAATIGYGLLVALGLAFFVSPFACEWPVGENRRQAWFRASGRDHAVAGRTIPRLQTTVARRIRLGYGGDRRSRHAGGVRVRVVAGADAGGESQDLMQ